MDNFDFETLAIHAGEDADPTTGALRHAAAHGNDLQAAASSASSCSTR